MPDHRPFSDEGLKGEAEATETKTTVPWPRTRCRPQRALEHHAQPRPVLATTARAHLDLVAAVDVLAVGRRRAVDAQRGAVDPPGRGGDKGR